jgi:hypothetical protein
MTVAPDSVIDLQQFVRDTIADYVWFSPPVSDAHPGLETRLVTPALR